MENTYIYLFSNFLSLFWFFIDYIVQILLSIWAFASKWTISEHNYKFEIPYFPIPPVEYNLQINKLSCPPIFSVSQLPVQSNDTHRNLPFNRLKILLFLSSQLPPRSSLCNCCWFYSSVWNWSINKHIFGCNRAVSLFSSWHCYSWNTRVYWGLPQHHQYLTVLQLTVKGSIFQRWCWRGERTWANMAQLSLGIWSNLNVEANAMLLKKIN